MPKRAGRRPVDAALLQIRDRGLARAQRGAVDLIRFAQQRVELFVLFLAFRLAGGLARHLEAHHLRERLDGLGELEVVVGHQEADRGAVRAAAEAVIETLRGAHRERRRFLAVERAQTFVVAAGALQRHARADDLDDIGAGDQLVDEVLWGFARPWTGIIRSEAATTTRCIVRA